jgi:hypothetical protein
VPPLPPSPLTPLPPPPPCAPPTGALKRPDREAFEKLEECYVLRYRKLLERCQPVAPTDMGLLVQAVWDKRWTAAPDEVRNALIDTTRELVDTFFDTDAPSVELPCVEPGDRDGFPTAAVVEALEELNRRLLPDTDDTDGWVGQRALDGVPLRDRLRAYSRLMLRNGQLLRQEDEPVYPDDERWFRLARAWASLLAELTEDKLFSDAAEGGGLLLELRSIVEQVEAAQGKLRRLPDQSAGKLELLEELDRRRKYLRGVLQRATGAGQRRAVADGNLGGSRFAPGADAFAGAQGAFAAAPSAFGGMALPNAGGGGGGGGGASLTTSLGSARGSRFAPGADAFGGMALPNAGGGGGGGGGASLTRSDLGSAASTTHRFGRL